jgi:hypothetical protein
MTPRDEPAVAEPERREHVPAQLATRVGGGNRPIASLRLGQSPDVRGGSILPVCASSHLGGTTVARWR